MKTESHTKPQSHEGNQVLPSIRDIVPPCEPATSSPLRDAVSRLAEAYQPEAIWLFGSQARGDARQDSDFDLLLVEKLSLGLSQDEISSDFKLHKIVPSSLSSIEKRLNKLKLQFKANNAIHLVAKVKDLGLI